MIQLKVRTRNAELVRQGLEDFTREIPLIGRRRIYESMLAVRTRLRKPGTRIVYPVNWDSERQRRFVIAMLRQRGNLPYQRTNALPEAWEIERADDGYRLVNKNDAAVYVYGNYEGDRQSNIHAGRWPVMQEEVEAAIQELPEEIEQNITYYAREKGLA